MITEIAPYNNYTGDGSTTQFDFDFYIESASQLVVTHTASDSTITTLTKDTDYSIHEVGNQSGSYITFPLSGSTYSTLSSSEVISLQLSLPISQQSEYGTSSELDLESVEYSFDYLTRIAQIQNRKLERSIKVAEGSGIDTETLVKSVNVIYANIDNINAVNNNKTNINTVAGDKTNIDTVAGSISNVNNVGNNISSVNSVAGDLSNIDAVNTNKTNINTVAGISSNVTTVAGISSDVTAVKNNATNINSVANDLTNINSVAADLSNIDNASAYAASSKQYAIGYPTEPTEGSAKYWASQASQSQIQSDWNQTDTTKKDYIKNKPKIQISNCILEDPQNINLTLSNGTLTLKAGSIVCVPNGFEADGTTLKFSEATISSDVTKTETTNGTYMIALNSNNTIQIASLSDTTSGTTPPTNGLFYNTSTNKINLYTSTTASADISFPFAIVTVSGGAISSIDQTFQSLGYIGSTIFCRGGLKGLIPNGRNSDGTLNSTEATLTRTSTVTYTGNIENVYIELASWNSVLLNGAHIYDEDTNYVYDTSVTPAVQTSYCDIGVCDFTNGVISNFTPFQTVGLVKYTDVQIQAPYLKATYVNGTSGYNIWSNGYCEQWGHYSSDTTVTLLKTFADTNYALVLGNVSNNDGIPRVLSKGQSSFNTGSAAVANCAADWMASGYLASGQY